MSPKAGFKTRRSQCDVCVQRRANFEAARSARKIPKPDQVPVLSPFFCDLQLVAADVKGRALPAIRGLNFDQAISPVTGEAVDVISDAIAILRRNPSDLIGKATLTGLSENQALVLKDALLSGPTEGVVAQVTPETRHPLSPLASGHANDFGHAEG